jgi:hypothetical protein
MVLECRLCGRVKKFGEWVEVSVEFRELVKEVGTEVLHIICPRCEEAVLVVASHELVKQA